MDIIVYPTHHSVNSEELRDKTAVVINNFRTGTTILTALRNGCSGVLAVQTQKEALAHRAALGGDVLLGGERDTVRIPGFDFGNSPEEYTSEKIRGRKLILTTTGGTLAIAMAFKAKNTLIACMQNARATAHEMIRCGKDCRIVCAGTPEGRMALVDVMVAGAIITELKAEGIACDLGDLAYTAVLLWSEWKDNLVKLLTPTQFYQRMIKNNMNHDLEHCLQYDVSDMVPRADSTSWIY